MEDLNPWVTPTKISEIFGWTAGQIRGYKDRLWTRHTHFTLIGGVLMYNPREIVKWQNSQVSDLMEAASKSAGNTTVNPTRASLIKSQTKPISKKRLASVKSSSNCAD